MGPMRSPDIFRRQRNRTTALTSNTTNSSAMQMAMTAVDSCSGDAPAPCSSSTIFFAQLIMAERIRPHTAPGRSLPERDQDGVIGLYVLKRALNHHTYTSHDPKIIDGRSSTLGHGQPFPFKEVCPFLLSINSLILRQRRLHRFVLFFNILTLKHALVFKNHL